MKIKNIGNILRKSRSIYLHVNPNSNDEDVIQYVGNESFIYAVDGLPHLTKEAAFSIFDVPTEIREDFIFKEFGLEQFVDDNNQNHATEPEPFWIKTGNAEYVVFMVGDRIAFVDAAAFTPIKDELADIEFFYKNYGKSKAILAKRGFEIRAIFCESKAIQTSERIVHSLEKTTTSVLHQYRDYDADKNNESEQMEIDEV
jgi:hypothetical protein